jgi:N-acetylmuramoyl-L-alanine amidase
MKKILAIIMLTLCFCPFLAQAKTTQIKAKTKVKTPIIKILIVPGHNNQVWGAQYGDLKEADMNLVLATKIYNNLKKDKRFKVYITRDKNGYTKQFSNYFSTQKDNIISFKNNSKQKRQEQISSGNFIEKTGVPHVAVSEDTSIQLYGTNKWANENKIDAVINVHFNDYPRPTKWTMGEYKGFSIYLPDTQMANAKKSNKLANNISKQFLKKYITSTFEGEKTRLVPDQKLIALGSNGTLNANVGSVVIEYGYIYRFGNSIMRHKAYTDMANLTVKAITKNFF